jgi:hypothetical protein
MRVYTITHPNARYAMKPIDATAEEEAVIKMLQRTGSCCLDALVMQLPNLSWAEVFVAVDRMTRDGRVLVRQLGYSYSSYEITLPSQLASPRSPARQEEP